MRLTPDQAQAIRQRICSHMGAQARIWLFGSRVDDGRLTTQKLKLICINIEYLSSMREYLQYSLSQI